LYYTQGKNNLKLGNYSAEPSESKIVYNNEIFNKIKLDLGKSFYNM
jgi:hypothetical protein